MNIHEYQTKELFRYYGIPTPTFYVANTTADVVDAAKRLNTEKYVLKAQVHAGGRGQAGGVKLVESIEAVSEFADQWIGNRLQTKQTDEAGQIVACVLIEEYTQIKHEYYLGVVIDRSCQSIVFMASSEGGMDIEQVAEQTPDQIYKVLIEADNETQATRSFAYLARQLELADDATQQFMYICHQVLRVFIDKDLSLIEINPLVLDEADQFRCLDGKINIDNNALFRQPHLYSMRDYSQEDDKEVRASQFQLNYISLTGNIGCMVNGAGLAMATMDIIQLYGGKAANFLDVGGGVNAQRVSQAFQIILEDPQVKTIFVNVFGGIVRCDWVAQGIIAAVEEMEINVPVVVRLKGNSAKQAYQILERTKLNITPVEDLDQAAQLAVEMSR